MKTSHMKRAFFLAALSVLPMHVSALDQKCFNTQDINALESVLKGFNQAVNENDPQKMALYMNFPITDNHNHAITQRVFLEEDSYGPVISVKKLFKNSLPTSSHQKGIKAYAYLDYCNMYTIENSRADKGRGIRFIFKKAGKTIKLKLIRFGKED